MVLGLPSLNELADEIGIPVLAHPAFAGSLRIAPQALIGKLFRLYGADAVIFPNTGGRFSYSREVCRAIVDALRSPSSIPPAFPVPAGGMAIDAMDSVLGLYGADTVVLVGGSLLDARDRNDLLSRGRRFCEAVHTFSYSR
jgi:ribulose-bisphosphate carboxylase large chain